MDIVNEIIRSAEDKNFGLWITMKKYEDKKNHLIYEYYHKDKKVAEVVTIPGQGIRWEVFDDHYHLLLYDAHNKRWADFPDMLVDNPFEVNDQQLSAFETSQEIRE